MPAIHRLTAAAAAAATALLLAVPAAARDRVFPTAAEPVLADNLPNPPVAMPGGVKVWRDVAYQTIDGYRPQIVDVYVPAGKARRPLVLYIHGGGWRGGHTRHSGAFADFPKVLAALAAEGFTVASLEYRLSSEARFPAQVQDANAALRFLRANAGRFGIDPARVGVWGGSAGGHLTALAATTCRDTALDPASAADGCVQAAAAWYGVFDMASLPSAGVAGSAERQLFGCTDDACLADRRRSASPVTHVDRADPPFLLVHGNLDKVVPVGQSHLMEARLREAGVPVSAIYIPDVDHSFVGRTPTETRAASLRAINATFDFFHDRLKVPAK